MATLALWTPARVQAQVTSYAVVPSWSNARVTLLDAYTGAAIAPILVPGEPYDAAVTPDGRYAYVTRRAWNDVVVIDIGTRAIVATIPLGLEPRGVVIAADGTRAYVTVRDGHRVSAIDTATRRVVASIFNSRLPWGLAIAPDGHETYVANRGSHDVTAVDVENGLVSPRLNVGREPVEIAVAPDGRLGYVTSTLDDIVTPIELASMAALPPVPVGVFPRDLAVTPDGTKVFIANSESDNVSVIDAVTHTVIATLPMTVNSIPSGVAITPDGTRVLIGMQAGFVRHLNALTHQPLLSTPVGGQALRLTTTPNLIVPAATPFSVGHDDDFGGRGFRDYVTFHGGVLRATQNWSTPRRLSILSEGGTIDTQGFDVEIAGGTVNNGGLVKRGSGTLTLSGANEHASSFVREGTLVVMGSHAGSLTLARSTTLAGTGIVAMVDGAGTISPGDRGTDIGRLSAETVAMGSGMELVVDVNNVLGICDRLDVGGGLTLDSASLTLRLTGRLLPGMSCVIATKAAGTFAGLPEGGAVETPFGLVRITYTGGPSHRDVVLTPF